MEQSTSKCPCVSCLLEAHNGQSLERGKLNELFSRCYDCLSQKTYAYARARLADPEEAKEVNQQAWVKLHEQLRKGQSIDYIDSYLYVIINHEITARQKKKNREISVEDFHDHLIYGVSSVSQDQGTCDECICFFRRLESSLTNREAEVYQLKKANPTIKNIAIAEQLCISTGRVENINTAIRKKAKELIQEFPGMIRP